MSEPSARDQTAARLAAYLPEAARSWLPRQRWYGGKAHTISGVAIEDLFWLPAPDSLVALVVLRITLDSDGSQQSDRYASLLRCGGATAPSTIGVVDGQPVSDATAESLPVKALLAGLHSGRSLPGLRGGRLDFADATTRLAEALAASSVETLTVVPVGAEQSNTSVRLGTDHVFKLFRRLQIGEHPQLEIGRFLARVGFRGVPPLEGSLTYTTADGGHCAIGAVEGWVPNSGDGWHDVVTCLQRVRSEGGDAGELVDRLATLGRNLAGFHRAMASDGSSPAFAPEPVTTDDLHAWHIGLRTQCDRTLALVERQVPRWPEPAASLARRVLASRTDLAAWIDRLEARLSLGWSKIRIHGDFHLGQTLRTRDGFILIDFEGEPSRPIAERRQKHSALRDVAGMLRSVEYAAATASANGVASSAGPDTEVLRRAFVDAYCAAAHTDDATFLPATRDALTAWLRLFELDKALYEIEYEANNRPAWVHIPLAALEAQRLAGHDDTPRQPKAGGGS